MASNLYLKPAHLHTPMWRETHFLRNPGWYVLGFGQHHGYSGLSVTLGLPLVSIPQFFPEHWPQLFLHTQKATSPCTIMILLSRNNCFQSVNQGEDKQVDLLAFLFGNTDGDSACLSHLMHIKGFSVWWCQIHMFVRSEVQEWHAGSLCCLHVGVSCRVTGQFFFLSFLAFFFKSAIWSQTTSWGTFLSSLISPNGARLTWL